MNSDSSANVEETILQAQALSRAGRCDEAIKKLEPIIRSLEGEPPEPRQVDLWATLADALEAKGERDKAFRWYKEALRIARALADPKALSIASQRLGNAYRRRGDLEGALEHYKEAESLAAQVDESSIRAELWGDQGEVREIQGKYPEAIGAYERSKASPPKASSRWVHHLLSPWPGGCRAHGARTPSCFQPLRSGEPAQLAGLHDHPDQRPERPTVQLPDRAR